MIEVLKALSVFFAYAVMAVFAQNAVFTRALGVSRLVKLVDDTTVDSLTFGALLCAVQLISAPLGYFVNLWLAQYPYRMYIRPLVMVLCSTVAFFIVLLVVVVFFRLHGAREIVAVLPMATFNTCILGTLFISTIQSFSLVQTMGFALGSGVGYVLAVQVVEQAVALVSSLPELLAALPDTLTSLERRLESFCAACPEGVGRAARGLLSSLPEETARLAGQVSSAVLQEAGRAMGALPQILLACGTTVLAVFFTLSAYPAVMGFFRRQLGPGLARAQGVKANVFATLGKWLKAECILLAVTFCQLLAGLLLIRQEYALLLAALIALIDALPVFGTGTVLVPWAAAVCLLGNVPKGIALLALFAVISVVRSVLEPKLVAAQAGLPPLASLAAMYVGFCAMGVAGMVLAPVLLLLVKQLHDGGYIRLWR